MGRRCSRRFVGDTMPICHNRVVTFTLGVSADSKVLAERENDQEEQDCAHEALNKRDYMYALWDTRKQNSRRVSECLARGTEKRNCIGQSKDGECLYRFRQHSTNNVRAIAEAEREQRDDEPNRRQDDAPPKIGKVAIAEDQHR